MSTIWKEFAKWEGGRGLWMKSEIQYEGIERREKREARVQANEEAGG